MVKIGMKVLHVISPSTAGSIESVGASWLAIMLCNEMVNSDRVSEVGIASKLTDYSKLNKSIKIHEIETKHHRINKDIIEQSIIVYDEFNYDIMHIHVHSLSVIKWMAKLIPDHMKVVYTLHTPTMLGRSSVDYGKFGKMLTNKSNFLIVAPSDYMRKVWCKFIGGKLLEVNEDVTNLVTVYNGTTREDIEATTYTGEEYALVCCRLDPMKRVLETLRAIDNLGINTIYIGDCWRNDKPDAYADKVREVLLNSKVITWIKKADNLVVKEYMKNAKVLINFSDQESFGLVATESISMGTPVIYSQGGALEEIMVDGVTGIRVEFPCRSSWKTREKLIGKAYESLSNGEISFDSEELVNFYKDRYTTEIMSSNYIDYYEKLINKKD